MTSNFFQYDLFDFKKPAESPYGLLGIGTQIAVKNAANEANRLRHVSICPTHLLYGIAKEKRHNASFILREDFKIPPERLQEAIEMRIGFGEGTRGGLLALSDLSDRIFRSAGEYAGKTKKCSNECRGPIIGTDHLLYALATELPRNVPAGRILFSDFRIRPNQITDMIDMTPCMFCSGP